MANRTAVGLDVGGTKMLGALVTDSGQILASDVRPTPSTDEPLVADMIALLRGLQDLAGGDVPIGVGFPGLITREGVARYGPNISLREHPLGAELSEALGTPVTLDNDANAATWAEFRIGAGRDVRDMLMFTLGTGVGGGVVVDGQLVRGASGFAGEVGHLIIDVDGRPGPSGLPGELEAYSSGTAIGRLAQEAHRQGQLSGTELGGPEPPTAEQVSEAALRGIAPAVDIMARVGRHLGIAAAGLANCLDPALVVVGGGAAAAGELILQPAREALHQHLLGVDHRPTLPVVPASLGSEAGVVGAALLAWERLGA